MKPLLLLVLVFPLAAAAQSPSTEPASKKEEASVAGMVVKLAGSEPLRKARVMLTSLDDQTRRISVTTDSGGRFELKGLQAGRYHLTVIRSGFVRQSYGQRKSDDPGAILTLRPGQAVKDLLFRLIPSAVITGKIVDEDSEPLRSVAVSALRQMYSEGKRTLTATTIATTNDLGEYRLFDLAPGRYFVSAVYPRWNPFAGRGEFGGSDARREGYAKMYYPGTTDSGKASSITVKAGEEIPSIDLLLRPVQVYRIRGRVFNEIARKPGTQTNILLTPKAYDFDWASSQQTIVQKKDGSFEIPEVLPGSYVLTAFWFDEGKTYAERVPVEVGNADVDGLTVNIGPGTNISGRIIWDGPPAMEKDNLTVRATAVDLNTNGLDVLDSARVEQGLFTLQNVGSGTYHAELDGQSKDCYVKDVRYSGSEALDEGFTVVRGTPGELEITVSSHGARVQGSVTDADGLPAAGVWVVLVPQAGRREQRHLYKYQTTDQYGHFDLRGIRPAEYKLFSWQEVETNAWESPEFLKPFEEKGEEIELQEGEQKTIKLTAIPGERTEPAAP
jgi:Carboxypeptidase regulatory-like domain